MSTYNGGRITVKPCGEWSSSTAYERLSLVYYSDTGNSYIARIAVPAGTAITNETYWMLSAKYSAQYASLVDDIATLKAQVNANASASTDADADYAAEVVDARVGADGTTYNSLGEAIREQVSGKYTNGETISFENGEIEDNGTNGIKVTGRGNVKITADDNDGVVDIVGGSEEGAVNIQAENISLKGDINVTGNIKGTGTVLEVDTVKATGASFETISINDLSINGIDVTDGFVVKVASEEEAETYLASENCTSGQLIMVYNSEEGIYNLYIIQASDSGYILSPINANATGSSTVVVSDLSEVEEPDSETDYILYNSEGCFYYRYIDSTWVMVGGSSTAEFITVATGTAISEALAKVDGDDKTDYFVLSDGTYHHYRYIEETGWVCIGNSVGVAESISALQTSVNNLQDSLSSLEDDVSGYGNRLSTAEKDIDDLEDAAAGIHDYDIAFDSETNTLSLTEDSAVKTSFVLPSTGGSGSTSSSTVTITKITSTPLTVLYGDECNIEYSFSAVDSNNDPTGDCTAAWYVSNVLVLSETVAQGTCSTDISSYLAVGSNNVRLRITDPDGAVASATWVVRTVNMYLESSFNDKTTYSGDVTFRFTPYGSGISKTVYIYLDGILYHTGVYTSSGVTQTITIPEANLGHGSHSLYIYCTATVNETEIQSDTLYFDIAYIGDEDTPVITCAYDPTATIMQYSATTFEYMVYNPTSQTSNITLEVYSVDADGNRTRDSSTSLSVDRTTQTWAYKPTDYGDKVLVISCGTVSKEIAITVEEFPYDVSEVDGVAFDFNPTGRSNNDSDYATYENNGYKLSVSDSFDWVNGGWKTDDDGNSYFCVKAGSRAYFDYPLFYQDTAGKDIKQTGLNFKFIYKATMCRDFEAQVMSCLSDNIGTLMTASAAYIYTGAETAVAEMPYGEDNYMELEWNITPDSNSGGFAEIFGLIDADYSQGRVYASTESFMQTTQAPIEIGSDECDVWVYRFKVYRTYLTDTEIIQNRIADAPDATEMAERYTRNDILGEDGELSYSLIQSVLPDLRVILIECPAFTQSKNDKVDGCTVTHIYPNGGNSHNWTATGVQIKGQGTSSNAYGASGRNVDIKCSDGFTFNDGTTSDVYSMTDNSIGVNYFNIKVNVASSENANNACLQDDFNNFQPYIRAARENNSKVRDTMEFHPCVIFVKETHVKSDGTAVSAVEFEDEEWHFYACGDFGNSKKNHTVFGMDTTNPNECIVEISNNTDKICLFKHDGTSFNDDGSANFEAIFEKEGWGDASDDDMKDNGWHNSVEFRYPEDFEDFTDADGVEWTAADHKAHLQAQFIRLYSFIASTDATAATNVALSTSVTYDGVTYTADTAAYRTAKFLNEFENYMVKDSVLYHYLFTERHTMVDNRAKNTFWHTSDGLIWDLTFNYDDDTADGNNNEGDLTLSFGLEDTDTIGSANVYNAASIAGDDNSSTLWVNVRENMYSDLASLYTSLEQGSTNVWSADRVLEKYSEYQWVKSERLQMFDMRRKYIRPYEEPTAIYEQTTMYLAMMYGRKTHQRTQFETYMEQYTSSKYGGTVARTDSNTIYFRSNSPGKIYVVPYCAIYASAKAGATTYRTRASRGEVIEFDFSALTLNDTETYIYSASLIQEIDGLASMYIGGGESGVNFSAGTKITKLIVGSSDDSYSNINSFSGFSVDSNVLLEVFDMRNFTNFTGSLDFSNCAALKEVYTTGTKCSGVTFATGGLVEKAQLNAVGALIAKNLTNLYYGRDDKTDTLTFESTASLTKIIVENSDNVFSASKTAGADTACINVMALLNACTAANRVRLIKMYWVLSSTDLLDRISEMYGVDESGYDQNTSVLTGFFDVPILYQSEKEAYETLWGEDNIEFKSAEYVEQYSSKFYSDSDQSVLLGTHYIDRGGTDYAPVANGEFDTPTKATDEKYDYEFAYWLCVSEGTYYGNTYEDSDSASWPTNVGQNLAYVAVYTATLRTFTVSFYNTMTRSTICTIEDVSYGSEVIFDYSTYGYPEYTAAESSLSFSLFTGWDKSTGYVTEDITVNTLWDTVTNNPTPASEKDTLDWSYADVWRLSSDVYKSTIESYGINGGSRFSLTMGKDYSFTNVDSFEIVADDIYTDPDGNEIETYFDGDVDEQEYPPFIVEDGNGDQVLLFADDAPSFTLVVDFEMPAEDLTRTILSCGDLRLRSYVASNGTVTTQLYWGSTTYAFSFGTQRNIMTIRHEAGSSDLNVYLLNNNAFSSGCANAITTFTLTNSSYSNSDDPLCMGGYLSNGSFYTSSTVGNGVGFIHWCKVWYGDLGDYIAGKLAAWPRVKCEYGLTEKSSGTYPFQRYPLATEDDEEYSNYAALSFQFITMLSERHRMNTSNVNSGGWEACDMRKFLNPDNSDCEGGYGRVWDGLPTAVQAMIVKVQTRASIGDQSTTIKVSRDYLTIASYQENMGSAISTAPYYDEGSYYNVFKGTADRFKVRFLGLTIPKDATYYVSSTSSTSLTCETVIDTTKDPTSLGYTVNEGDVWINGNYSNYGYIFVTNDTYKKYGMSKNYWSSADYAIQSSDGTGYWLRSANWWERSANVSNSTYFMYVTSSGYAGYSNSASNLNGVCPGFSIGRHS